MRLHSLPTGMGVFLLGQASARAQAVHTVAGQADAVGHLLSSGGFIAGLALVATGLVKLKQAAEGILVREVAPPKERIMRSTPALERDDNGRTGDNPSFQDLAALVQARLGSSKPSAPVLAASRSAPVAETGAAQAGLIYVPDYLSGMWRMAVGAGMVGALTLF